MKATRTHSQHSHPPGQDLNLKPAKYEARVLITML